MNIYILIVIYNELIKDSSTYKTLSDTDDAINFIFIDNSTEHDIKKNNRNYVDSIAATYIDMQGNKGLAKAYNTAIATIDKISINWIITCDQDTMFDIGYIKCLRETLETCDYKIIAPNAVASKKKISPVKKFYGIRLRNYYINSGMVYRADVFNSARFEEELLVDYIDFDLQNQLFNAGFEIGEFEQIISQSFSGFEKPPVSSAKKRFEIFTKDSIVYASKWQKQACVTRLLLFRRTLRLLLEYRDYSFYRLLKEDLHKSK